MSDLEEMGLILQPHTSAGRIPSDKGYRLYVDTMMEEKEREITEMKELMIEKTDRMEQVLKHVVKMLADNTNYTSIISSPRYHHNKLKFIQLSKVDEEQLLAVIVVEGNIVKNKIINLEDNMDNEMLLKLNILLNSSLNGLTLEEINLGIISKLKEQAGIHINVVSSVIDAVAEAIRIDEEDMEIYTSGATNILKYPELSDNNRATELIGTLEEKRQLASLIEETMDGESGTGIQVYIGQETPVQAMRDCSVVTATYDLGGGMQGTVGIIGPKRMDYDKVIGTMRTLTAQLDRIYKGRSEESDE